MTAPSPAPPIETVRSFDGSRIAYRDFGGSGPALVLLPGWACVQAMWDPAVPFLKDDFRVVSLDFAGFGRSTAEARAGTMRDFAEDVRAVVGRLDLAGVTLVGHSMGGAVALETARLCRGVVAVIGCDSFTYAEIYKRSDDSAVSAASAAFTSDYAGTVKAALGAYFLDGGSGPLAVHVIDLMARADPAYAVQAMENLLRWDVDRALADCSVPVATINARPFLTAEAEKEYAGRIAIETVEDVGHFLMMERPELFADALRRLTTKMRTAPADGA